VRHYSSQGIVLARQNFFEADRILTIFSKDYGKVRLLARGVRKPESRKRGHIEVFNYIKFSVVRGRSLDILSEVETIVSFNLLRNDLRKMSVFYFLAEAITRLTRDGEKNERLLNLILVSFNKTVKSKNLKGLRKDFIYQCLVVLGFWPEGRRMEDPDKVLRDIAEREMFSARVGKEILI